MTTRTQQLQNIFEQLPSSEQDMLIAFAEFLQSRTLETPQICQKPQLLPRPVQESVIGAIKRLSRSYPMLDKQKMLDETSALMSQHVLQGRNKSEVIDELELVFLRHYEALKAQFD